MLRKCRRCISVNVGATLYLAAGNGKFHQTVGPLETEIVRIIIQLSLGYDDARISGVTQLLSLVLILKTNYKM